MYVPGSTPYKVTLKLLPEGRVSSPYSGDIPGFKLSENKPILASPAEVPGIVTLTVTLYQYRSISIDSPVFGRNVDGPEGGSKGEEAFAYPR